MWKIKKKIPLTFISLNLAILLLPLTTVTPINNECPKDLMRNMSLRDGFCVWPKSDSTGDRKGIGIAVTLIHSSYRFGAINCCFRVNSALSFQCLEPRNTDAEFHISPQVISSLKRTSFHIPLHRSRSAHYARKIEQSPPPLLCYAWCCLHGRLVELQKSSIHYCYTVMLHQERFAFSSMTLVFVHF